MKSLIYFIPPIVLLLFLTYCSYPSNKLDFDPNRITKSISTDRSLTPTIRILPETTNNSYPNTVNKRSTPAILSGECNEIIDISKVTAYTTNEAYSRKNPDFIMATLPIVYGNELSINDLTLTFICAYFSLFKSPEIDPIERIDDFQILGYSVDEIVVYQTIEKYHLSMSYSIYPHIYRSSWLAGNGEVLEDGWIWGKYMMFSIWLEDDLYLMGNPSSGG